MKETMKEQLIATRQNQILEAAAKVFAEKGFHSTTIKDIAKKAGIAEGTIYIYFQSKTTLLIGILDLMKESAQQNQDFSGVSEGDFRSFLKAYLRQPLIVPKADNFELFRVVISEIMVNKELRELYYQKIFEPTIAMAENYFQQWAEQFRPINLNLTIRAISGMVFGLILEYIMGDNILEAKWDELPDFLADLILDGLGSNKS